MALYMAQFSYTGAAWAALARNPVDRMEAIGKLAGAMGGKLIQGYYSFGDYDGLLLLEMPDETTAQAFLIAAAAAGHLRDTRVSQLLTPEQSLAAMKRAGAVAFPPPTVE